MKTLLLLRHAKSSWSEPGSKDFDRPLKGKGFEDAALIGGHLLASGCVPDVIISSPALRARQTAEAVANSVANSVANAVANAVAGANTRVPGDAPKLSFDKSLYEAPTEAILQVARSAGEDPDVLMLVGHNPSMQLAALKFCGEGAPALLAEMLRGFPTTGLARFTFRAAGWRDISWFGATLLDFISAKALR